MDRFSKSCRLIPLKNLPTAMETAEQMFNNMFRYFGIPEDIVSDRGPQFISRVWKNFVQEIGRFLRTFCHGHQHSWNQFIGWAGYAQNSLRQQTTGLTPFQCVLGFLPPLFPWDGEPSDVPAVDYWFRERVWDRSTPPSSTSYGQAQIDSRPSIRLSSLPTWSEGLAVHTGHQIAPIL